MGAEEGNEDLERREKSEKKEKHAACMEDQTYHEKKE